MAEKIAFSSRIEARWGPSEKFCMNQLGLRTAHYDVARCIGNAIGREVAHRGLSTEALAARYQSWVSARFMRKCSRPWTRHLFRERKTG